MRMMKRSSVCHVCVLFFLMLFSLFVVGGAAQSTGVVAKEVNASQTVPAGNLTLPHTKENWSDLSLAGSDLESRPPFVAQRDDQPQFTRELIQVQWREGDPIDLYVIVPKSAVKPPVILYLYSYPSETDRFRNNDYCDRVTRGGFAAVGFVSALTGHRYHNRPMKQWFVSELREALVSSTHDVQMVLDYLSTRNDVDMDKVGMFGSGSGGTIAVLSASIDRRIKAIDLLDPWGDWPDWMAHSSIVPDAERPKYMKPEFLADIATLDPVVVLPKLNDRNVRMQLVFEDTASPEAALQKLETAMPKNSATLNYETGKELFTSVSGGRLFDWIKDQFRSKTLPSDGTAAKQKTEGEQLPSGKD